MDIRVGPISIDVVEPLQRLRVRVDENAHGVRADLMFTARARAVEEPRFTYRQGPRTLLDYTRLTQNGCYEGFVELDGKRIDVGSQVLGTRDRSWGVRPVGIADPQPLAPSRMPQFYWLWSPLNFDDRFMLYHLNADANGKPWNTASVIGGLGEAEPVHMARCSSHVEYKSGTRHARRAVIEATDPDGGEWRAELVPLFNFSMSGIGYGHPEWGHGLYKGENALGYDSYVLADVNPMDPRFLHIQAIVTAHLQGPGVDRKGMGTLEQLVLGKYAPSGFKDILDPAP
jgi:hypothetical protein